MHSLIISRSLSGSKLSFVYSLLGLTRDCHPVVVTYTPNGMPFSWRALAMRVKNRTISGAQRSAATAGSAARAVVLVAVRMCEPRLHRTTPARRAFGRNHAHLVTHTAQRASIGNHAQHSTTQSITSFPPNI